MSANTRILELKTQLGSELNKCQAHAKSQVGKAKNMAKRYVYNQKKMRKQAHENKKKAEVILLGLAKIST